MDGINLEFNGQLAILSLEKAPLNLMSRDWMLNFIKQFGEACKAHELGEIRCLLLKSNLEDCFSHGLDPSYILSCDDHGRLEVFETLAKLVEKVYTSGLPLVVDVNGPALAGGAVLSFLGDFLVMNQEKGVICFSETKVGLPIPRFIQGLIENKVPPSKALEVSLLGKNLDAKTCQAWGMTAGLYQDINEREQLLEQITGRIMRIAPAVSLQHLKWSKTWMKERIREFHQSENDFRYFVGNRYLGKGLSAITEGKKPVF